MKHTRELSGSSVSTARAAADSAVLAWKAVAEALVPIIGQSAVTVSYRRCLVSVGVEGAGWSSATAADVPETDWAALHAFLSGQTARRASEASAALTDEFSRLLGSLIGASLTEELLRPVSAFPTGRAAQDTFP